MPSCHSFERCAADDDHDEIQGSVGKEVLRGRSVRARIACIDFFGGSFLKWTADLAASRTFCQLCTGPNMEMYARVLTIRFERWYSYPSARQEASPRCAYATRERVGSPATTRTNRSRYSAAARCSIGPHRHSYCGTVSRLFANERQDAFDAGADSAPLSLASTAKRGQQLPRRVR
jgi:hypothetical protein